MEESNLRNTNCYSMKTYDKTDTLGVFSEKKDLVTLITANGQDTHSFR